MSSQGLSYACRYEGISGDSSFLEVSIKQPLMGVTRAVHKFIGGMSSTKSGALLNTIVQELEELGSGSIKFQIDHGSGEEGQSEAYEHGIESWHIRELNGGEDSEQYSVLEVTTIDKAVLDLKRVTLQKGFFIESGKISDHVREVCREAGVDVDIEKESESIPEFKRLYCPGIDLWSYLMVHLMPRTGGMFWLHSDRGSKLLFNDVSNFAEYKVSDYKVLRNNRGGLGVETMLRGYSFKAFWLNLTGEGVVTLEGEGANPSIEGSGPRLTDESIVSARGFHTKGGIKAVIDTRQRKLAYGYPREVSMMGQVDREGEHWHPNFRLVLSRKDHLSNGFCCGINHVITRSSYNMKFLVWNDKFTNTQQ